jgi:hypothetical protein
MPCQRLSFSRHICAGGAGFPAVLFLSGRLEVGAVRYVGTTTSIARSSIRHTHGDFLVFFFLCLTDLSPERFFVKKEEE